MYTSRSAQKNAPMPAWFHADLPNRSVEAFKYTDLSLLANRELFDARELRGRIGAMEYDQQVKLLVHQAGPIAAEIELVVVDGHWRADLSRGLSRLPAETVFVGPSSGGKQLKNAKLVAVIDRAVALFAAKQNAYFSSLAKSFVEDGFVFAVADSVSIQEPILISYFSTSQAAEIQTQAAAQFVHTLIAIGAHAQVNLLERFVSSDVASTVSVVATDVSMGANSSLQHVRITQEGVAHATHMACSRFCLDRDARLENFQLSLSGRLVRHDLHVELMASGAEAIADGVYLARRNEHVDHHTAIEHLVADTRSEQFYKGILADQGRGVFNGRIRIARDAQRSNSSQLNQNLLLSRTAEVDTKPELEIDADDVKASHGATVGRLNEEEIFYLMSRAIARPQAEIILSEGFAQEMVLRRSSAALRHLLQPLVAEAIKRLQSAKAGGQ